MLGVLDDVVCFAPRVPSPLAIVVAMAMNACGGNGAGADGGALGAGGLLAACTRQNVENVSTFDFDRSCERTSDCVAVPEGNLCYACEAKCPAGAINKSELAAYQALVATTTGGAQSNVDCNCPNESGPCCAVGTCAMGPVCEGTIAH